MPFDGSGGYQPPGPPTFPAVAGTKIRASYFNSTIDDIATALSNCWTRDGQSTATGTMTFVGANFTGNVSVTGALTTGGLAVITTRWATGEFVFTCSSTAPTGTIAPNGGTIGNASSSASTRANADTLNLFSVLWASSTNTELQLKDSSGTNVVRGVSAAADFAANRQLTIPNLADGEALLAAVSSTVNTKSAGAVLAHAHTFVGTAVPDHSHSVFGTRGDSFAVSSPWHQPIVIDGSGYNTGGAGGHTPAGTITNTLGAKNLAAGLFVKIYIAL
jgi:hypothetical protein